MARLADGFIHELKERIDLFDLISPYVQLKKSGASWVGLSPFQQEKTPSFYVHPQKGFFKCFSSGETGDAISFVQKIENLDFQESLEFLSERFGIPLRYDHGKSPQPYAKSIRAELHEINEQAKKWFADKFKERSKESEVAWKYWHEERNFDSATAEKFEIGFSPVNEFALGEYLLSKNFSPQLMSKSGLFREKQRQGKFVSNFQGRLMIPIYEKLGRICGFTARKLTITPEWGDKKAPKYINSPETPIFQKSQILFNLHLANKSINDENDFLLVEGQLDAIRCYIEGFETVIAPQGTAFTSSQASLLKKSNPRGVVCLLDGDEAGKKAGLKYIPIFLENELNARFAILEEGSDPDQILLTQGKERLKELLKSSVSMVEYIVAKTEAKEDLSNPSTRRKVCDFLFRALEPVSSFVVRESYLSEMASLIGVSDHAIKSDFATFEKNRKPSYRSLEPSSSQDKIKDNRPVRLTNVEDDLLFIILHDNRIAEPIALLTEPTWLNLSTASGKVLAKILAEIKADGPLETGRMEDLLEDDLERETFHRCLYRSFEHDDAESCLQLANECLAVLFLRNSKETEQKILKLLRLSNDESSKLVDLRNELKEVRKSRNRPPSIPSPLASN